MEHPASPRPQVSARCAHPKNKIWPHAWPGSPLPWAAPAHGPPHCTPLSARTPLVLGKPSPVAMPGEKCRCRPLVCKDTSVQQVQGPGVEQGPPASKRTCRWRGPPERRPVGLAVGPELPLGATTVLCLDLQARTCPRDLFACVSPEKVCKGQGMGLTHFCISKIKCL